MIIIIMTGEEIANTSEEAKEGNKNRGYIVMKRPKQKTNKSYNTI